MVDSFLPAIRGLVAHELNKNGVSQAKVAAALSMTQASVSQYLSNLPERYTKRLENLGVEVPVVERYVKLLSEEVMKSPIDAVITLYAFWRSLMVRGNIRHSHIAGLTISTGCEICERLFETPMIEVGRGLVLAQLVEAIRRIEASANVVAIMPNVGMNLVLADAEAKHESDVAGVPGRIVRVRGRAKATLRPEFGVSRHMAQMLLTTRKFNSSYRAAINIKYDHKMNGILKKMKIQVLRTADKDKLLHRQGDIVVAALYSVLEKLRRTPPVVVDTGGPGLEPMTYVFGSTAHEVVDRALEIASRYLT